MTRAKLKTEYKRKHANEVGLVRRLVLDDELYKFHRKRMLPAERVAVQFMRTHGLVVGQRWQAEARADLEALELILEACFKARLETSIEGLGR